MGHRTYEFNNIEIEYSPIGGSRRPRNTLGKTFKKNLGTKGLSEDVDHDRP